MFTLYCHLAAIHVTYSVRSELVRFYEICSMVNVTVCSISIYTTLVARLLEFTRIQFHGRHFLIKYVSKSDILGPIDYLSDIENLVSLERAMFKDYGFKYRIKIFLLFMIIYLDLLCNTRLEHHEQSTCQI